jgi:hypothetical protein
MQPKTISKIEQAGDATLGSRVGMLAAETRVPVTIIAGIMQVTIVTVYRWYKGESTPNTKPAIKRLRRMEWSLTQALSQGILPMEGKFNPDVILPLWKQSKEQAK